MNKAGAFLPRSQHLSASAHEQRSGSSSRRTSSSSLLCLVRCVMSIFVFAWALQCLTACAYQPLCKARLRPHPNLALTSLLFRSAIFFFSSTKFGTCFGLVYCSQASLQHLQPHIFLKNHLRTKTWATIRSYWSRLYMYARTRRVWIKLMSHSWASFANG